MLKLCYFIIIIRHSEDENFRGRNMLTAADANDSVSAREFLFFWLKL